MAFIFFSCLYSAHNFFYLIYKHQVSEKMPCTHCSQSNGRCPSAEKSMTMDMLSQSHQVQRESWPLDAASPMGRCNLYLPVPGTDSICLLVNSQFPWIFLLKFVSSDMWHNDAIVYSWHQTWAFVIHIFAYYEKKVWTNVLICWKQTMFIGKLLGYTDSRGNQCI